MALEPTRFVSKVRGGPVEASLFVVVRNLGSSPALDLRLRVSPPFTSLERFFKPGMMGEHFAEVNRVFNGEVHFRVLNPGKNYVWYLGNAPDIFQTSDAVPRRWEVHAEYSGTASPSPFHETYVIDLDVEKRIELPVDPLVRIGKDIEVVGDKLERIRKAIPGELNLSEASVDALRSATSATRPRTGRSRRPSWKRVR